MIPILHSSGLMIPGQLGPMSLLFFPAMNLLAWTISITGIPSVIQTIRGISASADSMMASAANGGGTKIIETLGLAASTASRTVLNTGTPSNSVPPLPGVTPATILVPYSMQALVWNEPSLPVIPCTINLVDLLTRILIFAPLLSSYFYPLTSDFYPGTQAKACGYCL